MTEDTSLVVNKPTILNDEHHGKRAFNSSEASAQPDSVLCEDVFADSEPARSASVQEVFVEIVNGPGDQQDAQAETISKPFSETPTEKSANESSESSVEESLQSTATAAAVRQRGKCKWFNTLRGWGFLSPENGSEDVFVHQVLMPFLL